MQKIKPGRTIVSKLAIVAALWSVVFVASACSPKPVPNETLRPTLLFKQDKEVVPQWRVKLTNITVPDRMMEDTAFGIDPLPLEYAEVGGDDDAVYAASMDRYLYKLKRSDGTVQWKVELAEEQLSRPVRSGAFLYVGTSAGNLVAFDPTNGKERWRYPTGEVIVAQPVVDDGMVYVVNQADKLIALEADTGNWVWEYREEYYGSMSIRRHSAPAIEGDSVFMGFTSGLVAAFDKHDGRVLWKRGLAESDRFNDIDAKPLYYEGKIYTASFNGSVYCLDADTGKPVWKTPLKGTSSLSRVGDRLYVGASEDGVYSLDISTGKILWTMGFNVVYEDQPEGEISKPVPYLDKYIVFTTSDNSLYVIDHVQEKLIARLAPGTGFSGEPLVMGQDIYLVSNGGYLYSLALGGKGSPFRKIGPKPFTTTGNDAGRTLEGKKSGFDLWGEEGDKLKRRHDFDLTP